MDNQSMPDRSQHVKTAKSAIWLLAVFGVAFAVVIFRFAFGSRLLTQSNSLPDSDATFKVAQQYIRDNMGAESLSFSSDGYRYAKKSDSIYVVRATAEFNDEEASKQVTYSVILKYKGGAPDDQGSWSLLDINRD